MKVTLQVRTVISLAWLNPF